MSPLMRQSVAVDVVHMAPPGAATAVYPMIGEPPSEADAVHATSTTASPAVAVTPVGAPGTSTMSIRWSSTSPSGAGPDGESPPAELTRKRA